MGAMRSLLRKQGKGLAKPNKPVYYGDRLMIQSYYAELMKRELERRMSHMILEDDGSFISAEPPAQTKIIPPIREPNKIPPFKPDPWQLYHEIKAPGWELAERRIERENIANWSTEVWCVIRARHPQLGLDIQAEYRFDADPNVTYERRVECRNKLWRQMVTEEAVEAGLV